MIFVSNNLRGRLPASGLGDKPDPFLSVSCVPRHVQGFALQPSMVAAGPAFGRNLDSPKLASLGHSASTETNRDRPPSPPACIRVGATAIHARPPPHARQRTPSARAATRSTPPLGSTGSSSAKTIIVRAPSSPHAVTGVRRAACAASCARHMWKGWPNM